MHLSDFTIKNIRCISHASVKLHKNINLIVGHNGSGKTSFLEGVYLLSCGKTFGLSRWRDLIHDGCESMSVAGSFWFSSKTEIDVSLEKGLSTANYTLQGDSVNKTSDVASKIPVLVGNSRAADLLTESPKARRDLLDRAVFHVKPSFINLWKDLRKALGHRNNLLKSGFSRGELSFWNQVVCERSIQMDLHRREIVKEINFFLAESILNEELGEIAIDYFSGWDSKKTLMEQLESNRESESRIGYTLNGAHRADLRVKVSGKLGAKRLSKGQLKVIAFESLLAIHDYISCNGSVAPIFLIDDLGSELDPLKLGGLAEKITKTKGQKIISSIQSSFLEFLDSTDSKVFHVEQGIIKQPKRIKNNELRF